jgi:L-amino acid N-acyltransferase YncA
VAVEIRPATPEDAAAIAEIHVASWRWSYRDILPGAFLTRLSVDSREAMWLAWFDSHEERATLLVAVEDGVVVGFAGAGPSRVDGSQHDTAQVRTIYLIESATGRGVGRALFASLMEALRAHRYSRATLWVFEANDRTRRFYEAAGWRFDGAHDVYDVGGKLYPVLRYASDL